MQNKTNKYNLRPLPGGRRDSIRNNNINNQTDRQTDNDNISLNSLTSLSVTEPYSPSTSSYRPTPVSFVDEDSHETPNPTLAVTQEVNAFLPASTKSGKPRVRMRWSKEVNLFIMRTYYQITKLETDMTTYRKQLHELFTRHYPDINVTEQRIADQRRTIVRNKLLTEETLHILKEEIRMQLQQNEHIYEYIENNSNPQLHNTQSVTTALPTQSQPHTITQSSHISTQPETITLTLENDIEIMQNVNPSSDNIQKIQEKFRTALALYSRMDPITRPKLPKLKYSRKLSELTHVFNHNILHQFLSEDTQLTDIHTLIYCTALVISEELNYKIIDHPRNILRKNSKPPWQIRLEKDIEQLRADCGRLTQYINNNRSNKIVKRVEQIFRRQCTHTRHENNNRKPEEYLDTLKQKLALKVHRLKRYKKAQLRKNDNMLFTLNEKSFYRNLSKPQTATTRPENIDIPTQTQLETFWSGIWEEPVQHNDKADWITEEENKWNSIEEMEFDCITEDDIAHVTGKLHNWKSPGIDKIHNYWYKKITLFHKPIAKNLTYIILGKQNIPEFIGMGITYMLPKTAHSPQPSQYRPITCLPTIYKILTSAIAHKINMHIEHNHIIAEEQKGCRRGHMGCKEQLIIDSTIHKHATTKNRNLHCTYIDYKKAFDSIPHSWLLKILHIYKINPKITDFMRDIMSHWKTTLHLNMNDRTVTTRQISIKKGIYQGDSLSPLWFCLALNPLSHLLQRCQAGYRLRNSTEETIISHLIYMDDIKLYAKSDKEMTKLLQNTTKFSKDINMEFGLDKCKTLHIIRGKIRPGDYAVDESSTIVAMESTDLYKYLGYKQLKGLDHTSIKQILATEYKSRTNTLCKTQLSAKNLIKALNTYAIPILTYSFGIIKWTKTDIEQIERTTRTTLTKHNNLHPKSAIERLTIKRENGGRGLIDIYHLWQKQVYNLKTFFRTKSHTSNIHKAITLNDYNFTPLNLNDHTGIHNPNNIDPQADKIENWKKKVLHGRHPHDLEQPHIDTIASNSWLKIGNLFPETEGFIIAIQDQIVNTKNYRKYIIKDATVTDDKCRKCHIQSETIQHITGACITLTQTDYTHRHNQITNIIHQKLALKHYLIQNTNTPYYNYTPQSVLESSSHKLYYDRAILTDRTIHYNRPDITLQDKINKTTYLIDIAVPNTHNLQKTITEKISKYTELKEEIIRIWRQEKVYIVPIVLSTTGVIPKHLHHSLKLINLNESVYFNLQKAAILNTCRTVRKFMDIEENGTAQHTQQPPSTST
ncbi:unnamed protein product [Arctia plantaginis]|uniref:Reverse transcriptase domain-containing protein n=1 Tax=Arctia plantaginis TaxID=874455 RepID=A0A8S0ZMH1_ARCPL|nr:unnamed protein product [Arctia plantaginis]